MKLPRMWKVCYISVLALATICVSGAAFADGQDAKDAKDAKPEEPKIALSGLLDTYYQYSFNHPGVGAGVGGRQFDVKADNFSVALLEVNATKAVTATSPIGFTATLTVGKNADLTHATEPGGTNTYKYLQQLYGTYLVNGSGKVPITIDFGKWASFCGYEVLESSSNDNYSRSFLYTFGQPLYHAGLRVTAPLTSSVSAGLYAVNGWNNVEDDNGGKTLGATLSFNSGKPFSVILNWMGGDEGSDTANGAGSFGGAGFATTGIRNVQQVDLVATWQATSKLKLGLNADYAAAKAKSGSGGNWNGVDVYGRYQFTPSAALALRWDHFEDLNGIRSGAAQNLNSITATLEKTVKSNLVLRLEYRHDKAGKSLFPSGGGGSNEQDTITIAPVVKF